jgi:hypothetical protein
MRCVMVSILVAFFAATSGVVSAQTPLGSPPPSFGLDYTFGTPLDGFEMRRYRDWQLTVNVSVPTSELQAVLPVGYQVLNAASATSIVSIALVLQERAEFRVQIGSIPAGSYGPVDEVLVVAAARNPLGATESVIIDNLRSTQEAANMTNTVFGEGSARVPDMLRLALASQPDGTMRFSADVVSGPLNIAASAIFFPLMPSSRNRPSGFPFRYVDSSIAPVVANRSLRAGTSVDQITIAKENIEFKRDQIRLPHGTLTVLGIVSGRLDRWQEFVQKLQ